MTKPLRHRRRAERYAQLLDEAGGGRRQHLRTPLDDELTRLVALRHQLVASADAPVLDPEFRTGLRAMLVATADREGIGAIAAPEPRHAGRTRSVRGPHTRTAVIAGVAVGAVAFAGISTASDNAVPGDPLYGVKRSTERAQLALASSDVGRGQLYLGFARTRLQEAQALTGDLARVLDDMDRDTSQGVRLLATAADSRQDLAALDVIDRFVVEQREALTALAQRVSGADAARVAPSLALLDTIAERATDLRRSVERSCPSATSIDTLGPVPTLCVALPAPSALDLGPSLAAEGLGPQSSSDPDPAVPGDSDQPASPDDDPSASRPTTGPEGTGEPGEGELGEGEEGSGRDDGGLLSNLNRLLGNLFGGG